MVFKTYRKAVQEESIAINAYIKKKIANTQCNLKELNKKQMKIKFSRRKETSIRVKINEIKARKKIKKANQ